MAKYKVIGKRTVAGVKPGGVVELDAPVDVRALLKARHIEPVRTKPATPKQKDGDDE